MNQVGFFRCIFCCFEAVLGLKINLTKCEMFQVGEVSDINLSTSILGCKVG